MTCRLETINISSLNTKVLFMEPRGTKYPNHLMNRKVMFIYNPERIPVYNKDRLDRDGINSNSKSFQ